MKPVFSFCSGLFWSLLLVLLTACQNPVQTAVQTQAPAEVLQIQLKLASSSRFHLQAARLPAEVVRLRFCLIEHPTGVSPAGGENLVPLGQVMQYTLSQGPPISLNISHLRANLTSQSYSLAVAALDALGDNITNSTGDNAAMNRVTIAGESGTFYLSSSGGDTTYPGTLRVEPISYALSGSATLGVTLKLADG